jgi:hypothetical protein
VTRKICVLFLFAASYDAAFFFEPLWYFIETQKDVPSNKVSDKVQKKKKMHKYYITKWGENWTLRCIKEKRVVK